MAALGDQGPDDAHRREHPRQGHLRRRLDLELFDDTWYALFRAEDYETLDEAIKYPIYFEGEGPAVDVILAGPTCDSMDILYEKTTYMMPESARIGDRVYILTTGAYTQSYSSIYFNGFPPLTSYILK